MSFSVKILASGVRPVRGGGEFLWTQLLDASRDGGSMTQTELRGRCDAGHTSAIGDFLRRMVSAGYIEATDDQPRRYRIVKPQRDCPSLKQDGTPDIKGRAQQQLWNVMRRARLGFTIEQLMIDAATDDVAIGHETARSYVRLLQRAGVVKLQNAAQVQKDSIFVLTGSGNTGPKAPRRMRTAFMYDPNTCSLLGEVVAQEDRT